MSVESVALVLNYSRATGRDKLVLVGIANHDGDGGAWPSLDTLMVYASASRRSVQRSIDALVELGELEVVKNAGGQRDTRNDRRPNLYRILVTRPNEPVESPGDNPNHGVPPADTPQPARGVSPGNHGVSAVGTRKVLRTTTPQTPHCVRHRRHRSSCVDCVSAAAPVVDIPPWCGSCDPAGEHDPGQRLIETRTRGRPAVTRCPRCHPANARSAP